MQIIPPQCCLVSVFLYFFMCGTGTSSLRRSKIIATEKHIISNYTNQAGRKYTKNTDI